MLLQPEIPTMLFSLLAFLFLMFFMSRFFLKPVLQLMEKRKNYIQKQLQEAEETNKKALMILDEQKELLLKAKEEAKNIIQQAKVEKGKEAEKIIADAKNKAEEILERSLKEIQMEKMKALNSLKKEVGNIAVLLASKLLKHNLDREKQAKILQNYFQELGKAE